MSYDAVVVGGGVAGSVAARELGTRGLSVLLVERERHPRPKPCGEGLLPAGVAALEEMGLALDGPRVRGVRYVAPGGGAAEGDFPGAPGTIVRRERFDAFLFGAAAGTPNVTARCGREWDPARDRGRFVVGADGLRSLFHGAAGFRARAPRRERVGLSTHVEGLDVLPDRVEVLFHGGGEVYLAPAGGGEALVACLFWRDALPRAETNERRVLATLERLPALRGRIGRIAFTGPVLGAGPLGTTVTPAVRGTTLLVGDASGAPDPVVGEGMSLAIRSARAAAAAIAAGRPSDYARAREGMDEGARWVAGWILRAARLPRVADRVVAALGRDPATFAALLGVVSGERPRHDVSLTRLLSLAA